MKDSMGGLSWAPPGAIAPGGTASRRRCLFAELGQNLDNLLLAVHHFAEKAVAIDVAVLVPAGFHQDVGLLSGRDGDAVGGRRKGFAVELADLLGDVLDEVDSGVALDAVVVADVVEALLEAICELLDGRDRRIDGEADMTAYAIGGLAGELDHLLAQQRRLANQWRLDALLSGFAQEAGTFLLVGIDEDRVGIGGLDLDHVGGEVGLPRLG